MSGAAPRGSVTTGLLLSTLRSRNTKPRGDHRMTETPEPRTRYLRLALSPRVLWAAYALLLVLLAGLFYGDLWQHRWAFDDEDFLENARIAHERFSYILDPDKPFAARPVVHLYFWAAYRAFGNDPAPYHMANASLVAPWQWLRGSLPPRRLSLPQPRDPVSRTGSAPRTTPARGRRRTAPRRP